MKSKQILKKLELKKNTVANLVKEEQLKIKGGTFYSKLYSNCLLCNTIPCP